MSMTIQVPDDLYRQAAEMAREDHISVDEVFVSAFEQHLALIDRFKRTAARGDRRSLRDLLKKAPDVEPEEGDRIR